MQETTLPLVAVGSLIAYLGNSGHGESAVIHEEASRDAEGWCRLLATEPRLGYLRHAVANRLKLTRPDKWGPCDGPGVPRASGG